MEKKIGYKDILKQKEFMKLISSSVINRFGDSIDAIAFTWLVYQISGSASLSAIIFGLNRLPTIFLTPIAATYVDRANKKTILVITDIIRGVVVGFIALAYIYQFINVPMLMIATIIISSAESFRNPASNAITPLVLDESHYTFGLALASSCQMVSELIGTGLAAIIIATIGIGGAILIDMLTFFLSALIILTMKPRPNAYVEPAEKETTIQLLKGGLEIVRSDKLIWFAMGCAVFLNAIFTPINSLQAPLVSEVLFSDETMLAVLGIGFTAGSLFGGVVFPFVAEKFSIRFYIISTFALTGIGFMLMIPFGYIDTELMKMIAVGMTFFTAAVFIAFFNSYAMVVIMKRTPQQYLARVTGILNACCSGCVPLVSFTLGALAAYITTAQIFFGCGVIAVLATLFYGQKRHYKGMEEIKVNEPQIILENS